MTKPLLFCDTETYCETPITNGTWAYAEKVEITLFTYAFGDGPVQCWDKASGEPMPADLEFALNDPEQQTVWHNSGFDSTVLRFALGIILPPERIIDTMVQAMSHGLPGSLDKLCDIFKVGADKAKHKTGHALVLFFCKPQPFTHNISKDYGTPAERKAAIEALRAKWIGRATPFTHPEKWAEFVEYAKADITAMRELYQRHLPRWNYPNDAAGERSLWALDQVCNQRGVYIDIEFAKAAVRAAERAKISLAAQTQELTSNEVSSATKRDQMIDHIFAEYGISLDNMKKATLNRMLEDPDVPAELKVLLNVRLQATSTSVSKYAALVKGVSSDSRLRGTIQFYGAQRTGRAAGRLFQPQNLPRLNEVHVAKWLGIPIVKGRPARDITDEELDRYFLTGVQTVLSDSEEFFFDEPMMLLSNCVRGSIAAPKGKKLVISDLSNIEGRVIAWLCGEDWKLQAFRDFDTFQIDALGRPVPDGKGGWLRKGSDLYKVAYGKSFGMPPEDVDKFGRQVGKVQELAFGFQGGVGAFVTFALAFNIDLDIMAEKAIGSIPADVLQESESFMLWAREKGLPDFGLSDKTYIVVNAFKILWRRAHPQISSYWKELENDIRAAISSPNEVVTSRKLKIQFLKGWLRIRLPSGRFLCYPQAQVAEDGTISYMGVNQYTRKWERITTSGGKALENATQGMARDVFYSAKPRLEDERYEIVEEVHDEYLTETPDTPEYSSDKLSKMMATAPEWAPGLPLAAAGFECYMYKKG